MLKSVEKPTAKKRRPTLAAILNLIGPGSGYLYVGRPKRALVAAATEVAYQLVRWNGLGGWLAKPWAFFIAFGLAFVLHAAFLIDAARIALRGGNYELRWYNRGWIYIGAIIATVALESLDQVPGSGISASISFFSVADAGMTPTLRVGEGTIVEIYLPRAKSGASTEDAMRSAAGRAA